MKAHRLAVAIPLLATMLAMTACGSSDDGSSSTSSSSPTTSGASTQAAAKPAKVAFVVNAYTEYQQVQEGAMKKALAPSGGSVKVFNANFDPQKLVSACQDAISSGRYDVIALNVYDPPTGVPCAKAAAAAKIPVVVADIPVGTDPNNIEPQVDGVVGGVYQTPDGVADQMIDLTTQACEGSDPCKILAEVGTPTDPLTNESVEKVKTAIPNAEIVQKFATNYDPSVIAQKMPDLLAAHPDANVFLSIADSQALAALPAIKAAGMQSKLKILGQGGSRLGAQAVADGTLFGSTGNWPAREGTLLAQMAMKAANGEKIEPAGVDAFTIDTPKVLVKGNVDQFTPEWGAKR